MPTVFDDLRSEIAAIFDKHRGEVEQVISDAEQVATNPVARQIGSLVHIPSGALNLFGLFAAKLDEELAKVVPDPTPAAPAAGSPVPSAAAADSAAPAAPSTSASG